MSAVVLCIKTGSRRFVVIAVDEGTDCLDLREVRMWADTRIDNTNAYSFAFRFKLLVDPHDLMPPTDRTGFWQSLEIDNHSVLRIRLPPRPETFTGNNYGDRRSPLLAVIIDRGVSLSIGHG